MSYGTWEQAQLLLQRSQGGSVLNTAFIERFNGTMRERLASLNAQMSPSRPPPSGTAHRDVSDRLHLQFLLAAPDAQPAKERGRPTLRARSACTPAMASGVTDHVWSVWELLRYRIAPPPWSEPRRRGRPRLRPLPDPTQPKRPRGRPRTRPLPDPTMPKRPRGRPRKAGAMRFPPVSGVLPPTTWKGVYMI